MDEDTARCFYRNRVQARKPVATVRIDGLRQRSSGLSKAFPCHEPVQRGSGSHEARHPVVRRAGRPALGRCAGWCGAARRWGGGAAPRTIAGTVPKSAARTGPRPAPWCGPCPASGGTGGATAGSGHASLRAPTPHLLRRL
ncbi:hypothetical protein Mext_0279 [Methylorubrum extorquens PA1]|nr:hypothetical protein Mext_0279 [Methylorubrum extorquens PA1]